jgi:hypothetical protein
MTATRRNSIRGTALALITGAVLTAVPALASQSEQQPEKFQRSFALNSGETLRVENYRGTIHVTGGNTNQVVVNVVKRFEGSESARKWWMDNLRINFSNNSSRVAVEVKYPNMECFFCWDLREYSAAVELEIQVPRQTNIDLDGYKPDIRVSSVQGDIRIKSYKAPMTIASTAGAIRIETYKDTIRLKDVAVRGGLEVSSYKADMEIEAKSLEGASRLESDKGDIVVRVPSNIGLDVDYTGGRRGSFRSDFPLTAQAGSRFGSDVHGTINQGGTHLRLRTVKGSVSLQKLGGTL